MNGGRRTGAAACRYGRITRLGEATMDIDIQNVLIFVHVLLFGYWLGSDLGVFFCDSQLTREDLSLDERLRVRKIRRKVDMAPRTCVAVILPIGFSLAVQYGSPITGWWLALIWVFSLAWLVSLWAVRLTVESAVGRTIDKYDRVVWASVAIAMTGFGLYALITGNVITESWLATKITLYGLMVVSALWIFAAGDRWAPIFEMIRAGGEEAVEGEKRMKRNRINCGSAAGTLWAIVLLIAFVGATKPF